MELDRLKIHSKEFINSEFSPNSENWKYTNYKKFNSLTFNFTPEEKKINIQCKPFEIIIYNGYIDQIGSALLNKIIIENIYNAVLNNTSNCNNFFNKILPYNKNIFSAYNNIMLKLGLFIHVPKNIQINEPIKVKHIIDDGSSKSFMNFRWLILVDENSSIKIINDEKYKVNHALNTISETVVKQNAKLELINYSFNPFSQKFQNFAATILNNASLNLHCINLSGKLIKNNYFINLDGKNSECFFNGLDISDKKSHLDSYVEISHNKDYSKSNLDYKIISHDMSCSIFYAKSIINQLSSNCEAHQKNNNIILSPKSKIYANPQLEIYNDEVQCSHSSTTGQIEEESIFYLRSRGINKFDAKLLLLNGLINNMLNKLSENILSTIKVNQIYTFLEDVNRK